MVSAIATPCTPPAKVRASITALPVATKDALAPKPANVVCSVSVHAKAPAMRSLGLPAVFDLPVASSCSLANFSAMLMKLSNNMALPSSSDNSSVSGGS